MPQTRLPRFRTTSRPGALALAAGLLGAAALPLAAGPAAAVTSCSSTQGTEDFYDGPSASKVYDGLFSNGPSIPGLPDYTPQGLVSWSNWDGKGHTILLLAGYSEGHRSRIWGIDPGTGDAIGSFYVAEAHLGGLAVAKGFLFGQDRQGNTNAAVRRYRLADVKKALLAAGTPYLGRYGDPQRVYSAEFMTSYNGYVWSGHYRNGGTDKMYQYSVSSTGKLSAVGSSYKVPEKTQGLLVTSDRFVFSTSDGTSGAGRLYVTTRTHNFSTAAGRCFRSPSMSEGIAAVGGTAYLNFESGSAKYSASARNVITKLHKAPTSDLLKLS